MRGPTRSHYLYIDDTGHSWWFNAVDYLAEAGNLQVVSPADRHKLQPLSPNYKPRGIRQSAPSPTILPQLICLDKMLILVRLRLKY